MSATFKALLVLGVAAAALAAFEPLTYKDCKSTFAVTKVEVDGCPKDGEKCAFKRGEKPSIKITFTPDRDVATLKAAVRSKIADGSTFVPFTLQNADACASGLSCPLKAGQSYTYEQSVEIADSYPLVDDVQVNWSLVDEDEATAGKDVCIVFLAKISE